MFGNKVIYLFICLLILSSLSSCSFSLPGTMNPPYIPPSSISKQIRRTVIAVGDVVDFRNDSALAISTEGKSEPQTRVQTVVREAIESALRDCGFVIDPGAPVVVNIKIRRWIAKVEKRSIYGEAELGIEVFDPTNKRIYSGSYEGFANQTGTWSKIPDIERVLGTAMQEAITHLVSDDQFVRLVTVF